MRRTVSLSLVVIAAAMLATACGGKKPPTVAAAPPPATFPGSVSGPATATGGTPERPPEPPALPPESDVRATPLSPWENRTVDEINGPDSPLKPVFFAYDSDELDDAARQVLAADAEVLKTYGTWVVTIEGHCDERGTAEYNLALGDRRALAARNYLVSLGIGADRMRTVSYGKEFPFDPGHDERAWAQNRRAHFMLTSK